MLLCFSKATISFNYFEGFLNLVSLLKNRFVSKDLFFCFSSLTEVP